MTEAGHLSTVTVHGAGLPALAAAFECARVGIKVRILLGDMEPDTAHPSDPLEPTAPDPDGHLAAWLDEISSVVPTLDQPLAHTLPAPRYVVRHEDAWLPFPEPNACGIPAVPLATDARALLGTRAATRAFLDRVTPVLSIGKVPTIGELARRRMGAQVVERLVDPWCRWEHGRDAREVDVAIAAPGLNEALTRTGALTAGVLSQADRQAQHAQRIRPVGGWQGLRSSLLAALEYFGAEVVQADPAVETPHAVTKANHGEADATPPQIISVADLDQATSHELLESLPVRDVIVARAPVTGDTSVATTGTEPTAGQWQLAEGANAAGERWSAALSVDNNQFILVIRGLARDVEAGGRWADPPSIIASAVHEIGIAEDIALQGEHHVRPAPFASLAARDEQVASLDRWSEGHPEILVADASPLAGDVSLAVRRARAEAGVLRRHLTGIVA